MEGWSTGRAGVYFFRSKGKTRAVSRGCALAREGRREPGLEGLPDMERERTKKMLIILFGLTVWALISTLKDPGIADFSWFYTAAMQIRMGQATRLYSPAAYTSLGAPYARAAWHALVFLPFTLFPYRTAFWVWRGVSTAVLLLSVWILRGGFRSRSVVCELAFLLGIIAAGESLSQGQDAAIFLLLVVLAVTSLAHENDFDAGVWLGLASINLHLIVLALLFIAYRRRWKAIEGTLLVGAGLFLLSTAVAGPNWVRDCILAIGANANIISGPWTGRGILTVLGFHAAVPVLLCAGAAASFWLVRHWPLERAVAWLVVGGVFFNWHSFIHNYVVLLPAAATGLPELHRGLTFRRSTSRDVLSRGG